MNFVDPKLKYKLIRDDILALFRNNKTALNVNLTSGSTFTANTQIIPGDPRIIPVPNNLYPVVMVKVVSKMEEFLELGHAGRKKPRITYRIYGITRIVTGHQQDTEIMRLIENIEGLLRDNIDSGLSSYILYSDLGETYFGIGEVGTGVYVDVASIDLLCICEVK